MQIETVSVIALLVVEEKLAKLRSTERGSDHTIVEHELVYGEYCDGTLASRMKSEVRGVGRPSTCGVVNVFCVYHNLLQVAVLSEVFDRFEFLFGCDLGGDSYHVNEGLLNHSQIGQLLYFLSRQVGDLNFVTSFDRHKP